MRKIFTFLFIIFLSISFLLPDMALALALSPQTREVANKQNHLMPDPLILKQGKQAFKELIEQLDTLALSLAMRNRQEQPIVCIFLEPIKELGSWETRKQFVTRFLQDYVKKNPEIAQNVIYYLKVKLYCFNGYSSQFVKEIFEDIYSLYLQDYASSFFLAQIFTDESAFKKIVYKKNILELISILETLLNERQKKIEQTISDRNQAVDAIAQLSHEQYPDEQEKTLVYPGGCVDMLRVLPLTRAGVRTFIFFNRRQKDPSLHLPKGKEIYYNPIADLPANFIFSEKKYDQAICQLLRSTKACCNFQIKYAKDQFAKIEISFEYKLEGSEQYVPLKIILFDVAYEAPNFFTEFLELPELKNKAHFLFSRRSYLPSRGWVIHVINKLSAPNGLITISDESSLASLPDLFTEHLKLLYPKLFELPAEQDLLEQANKFGFVETVPTPDFKVCVINQKKIKTMQTKSFQKMLSLICVIRSYFNFAIIERPLFFIKRNHFSVNALPFLQKMVENVYVKDGYSKKSELEGDKQLLDAALLLYAEPEILQNLLPFDSKIEKYPVLSQFYLDYKKYKFLKAGKIKQTTQDIFFLKDMNNSIQKIHVPALRKAFGYLTKKELEQLKKEIEVYSDLFFGNAPNKNFWINLISNVETIIGNREERLNTIIFKDATILSSLNKIIEDSLLEMAA